MIIVNGWKPLIIITKCSILHVAAVLNPPRKQVILYSVLHNIFKKHFMAAYKVFYCCSLWFSLLDFCMSLRTALDFAFFNLDLLFGTIFRANEWVILLYIVLLLKLEHFFVTSDVALLKNAFMYDRFFNSKTMPSTGIFL